MANPKKIAVIIAAYNVEKRIENCIESVQSQTYPDWEIYVVDDGSTDRTGVLLDRLARNDDRIKVFHISNSGKWYAHRIAIDAAKGCDFAIFLDSDDNLMSENLFEICIEECLKGDIDIVSFNLMRDAQSVFKIKEKTYLYDDRDKVKNMLIKRIIDGNICGAFYRYDIIEKNYEIMKYCHEDYQNKYAFILNASKISILPIIGYYYYRNPDGITQKRITEKDYYYYLHAKEFTDKIRIKYPDLEEECDYFDGSILLWTAEKLEQDKNNRELKMYQPVMQKLRFYTRRHVYRNKYFTLKDRMVLVLIYLKLYRLIYRIHIKVVCK